jgi:membrane-associated protease RseP (regulator of RpoE activity)
MRWLFFLILLWVAFHVVVLQHEWTHGTIAWLTGYKSSPFHIHYGHDWFMFRDIDEAVDYPRILQDGKPSVMAAIAIAPELLQAILFPILLKCLPALEKRRWLYAFVLMITLVQLAGFYDYIPIRTFSKSDDMYNFLYATGLSPWFLFIPGMTFVIWGIRQYFFILLPHACSVLQIQSKLGKFSLLLMTVLLMFGYCGGIGFVKPDQIAHIFSAISWALIPFMLFFGYKRMSIK